METNKMFGLHIFYELQAERILNIGPIPIHGVILPLPRI